MAGVRAQGEFGTLCQGWEAASGNNHNMICTQKACCKVVKDRFKSKLDRDTVRQPSQQSRRGRIQTRTVKMQLVEDGKGRDSFWLGRSEKAFGKWDLAILKELNFKSPNRGNENSLEIVCVRSKPPKPGSDEVTWRHWVYVCQMNRKEIPGCVSYLLLHINPPPNLVT